MSISNQSTIPTNNMDNAMLDDEARYAVSNGLQVHDDPIRGCGRHMYSLGQWYIWYCRLGWACAYVIDDHYTNHRYTYNLESAVGFVKTVRDNLGRLK